MAEYTWKFFSLVVTLISLHAGSSNSLPNIVLSCYSLCEAKFPDQFEKHLSIDGCIEDCLREVLKHSTVADHRGENEMISDDSRDKRQNKYLRMGRASSDESLYEEGPVRRPNYLRIGRSDPEEKRAGKYLRIGRQSDGEASMWEDGSEEKMKRNALKQRTRPLQYMKMGKRSVEALKREE